MADDEVATKAPESDANEPSMISSEDTKAQRGASMGDHCVTDRPSPTGGQEPTGVGFEISKIADVEAYITKPSDYPHLPSKLLLLLSSGTGIHSKNNQLQADRYAAEGFLVVMPDQFGGDPAYNSAIDPNTLESNPSILEKVKVGLATTAKSFMLDMWLARQTPEKVLPLLQRVIEGVKEEFADAIANGGGIYAVGYCFGGKYVCLLGSELPDTVAHGQALKDEEQGVVKSGPLIKAGALAHGTLITKEDMENLKSPVSMVCIEDDPLFPDDIRIAGQTSLEENKIEHEMNVYPGAPHGFGVVGQYDDPKIQEAQKLAFEQMVGWLKAH